MPSDAYRLARFTKAFRSVWLSFNDPMMYKIAHKTGYLRIIAPYCDRD